jgi:hypothetical protein
MNQRKAKEIRWKLYRYEPVNYRFRDYKNTNGTITAGTLRQTYQDIKRTESNS